MAVSRSRLITSGLFLSCPVFQLVFPVTASFLSHFFPRRRQNQSNSPRGRTEKGP